VQHDKGKSAVIAGFAVETDALSEISFLSSLGLSEVAVVYVSHTIPIAPYEFLNKVFKRYIEDVPGSPGTPEFPGITIYARFVPNPKTDMLGRLVHDGE
jgi:hypothetical protein